MRTCPNCGHSFDDRGNSPPNCPSCGREFTVSDIGAATIDIGPDDSDESPVNNALTVVEPPGAGAATISLPPAGGKTTPDQIAMTLQSGRWSPSASELAEAGSAAEIMQTIDSSFLGTAGSAAIQQTLDSSFLGTAGSIPVPPRPRGATEMWDSSHALSESQLADLGGKKSPTMPTLGSSAQSRGSMANRSVAAFDLFQTS